MRREEVGQRSTTMDEVLDTTTSPVSLPEESFSLKGGEKIVVSLLFVYMIEPVLSFNDIEKSSVVTCISGPYGARILGRISQENFFYHG